MSTNVMLDIETMGKGYDSAITEIGACVFSSKEGILDEFSSMISLQSCLDVGLTVSADTIFWWTRQKWEARKRFIKNDKEPDLITVLHRFSMWVPKGALVWGNGSDFDNVILTNAYRTLGIDRPWPDFNDRCFRTVKKLFKNIKEPERKGTHHAALDDAKHQALWLIKIGKEGGLL